MPVKITLDFANENDAQMAGAFICGLYRAGAAFSSYQDGSKLIVTVTGY